MADAGNPSKTPEKTQQSSFANVPFTFTPPGGGTPSAFPAMTGFGEALAALDKKGDEPLDTPEVQARVDYLKKLQEDRQAHLEEYKKERVALEKKYSALYGPLYEKRSDVVAGRINVVKNAEGVAMEAPAESTTAGGEENADHVLGIPEFWLRSMVNNSQLAEMIAEEDVPALKHLIDIKVTDGEDYTGFKIEFFFSPNPFFSNSVLSKVYEIPNMMDDEEPILRASQGTNIEWLPGKNLCVKEKRMKPKGKNRGGVVIKQVPKDSFFNFFAAIELPTEGMDDEDEYEDIITRLEYDYTLATIFRQQLVPEAVKWYNDEGEEEEEEEEEDDDEDYDDDDEEEDSDEGDDDSDDDDEDEVERPISRRGHRGEIGKRSQPLQSGQNLFANAPPTGQASAAESPECKQS